MSDHSDQVDANVQNGQNPPGDQGHASDLAQQGTYASSLAFGRFLKAASCAGALDEKTKELIAFSLAVFSRCEPCLAMHVEKAQRMGITREEQEEAAWLAVMMGGATVRMFYTDATGRR